MADGFHGSLNQTAVVAAPTRVLNVRAAQARVLWDNGWGRGRFQTFAQYLATIPPPPMAPEGLQGRRMLLVDTSVRLTDACRMLGVAYQGDDTIFSVCGNMPRTPEVYWLWVFDGATYRGRAGFDVQHKLPLNERGLTAFEGVSFYAQYPRVPAHHAIDLLASRLGNFPAYTACLLLSDDGHPTLGVSEYCVASSDRGAATCVW